MIEITPEKIDAVGKILVAAWVAWLTYRQKHNQHDMNVWFAKQREKQNGKCWTTQIRKPFKIRLVRKRKKKTEANKEETK